MYHNKTYISKLTLIFFWSPWKDLDKAVHHNRKKSQIQWTSVSLLVSLCWLFRASSLAGNSHVRGGKTER